jgi:hypothetical protein
MRGYEDATAPQAGHVCPACHQPLTEKITRHRTWGLFVPVWKPGPCHNPSCPRYVRSDRKTRSERDRATGSERAELAALRRENRRLREEADSSSRHRGSR